MEEAPPQDWINSLGYVLRAGPDLAPSEPEAERSDYGQVVLEGRVRLTDLNLTPQGLPRILAARQTISARRWGFGPTGVHPPIIPPRRAPAIRPRRADRCCSAYRAPGFTIEGGRGARGSSQPQQSSKRGQEHRVWVRRLCLRA